MFFLGSDRVNRTFAWQSFEGPSIWEKLKTITSPHRGEGLRLVKRVGTDKVRVMIV